MRKPVVLSALALLLAGTWFLLPIEELRLRRQPEAASVSHQEVTEAARPDPAVVPEAPPAEPHDGTAASRDNTWIVRGRVMEAPAVPNPGARVKLACFTGYEAQGEPQQVCECVCDDAGGFACALPVPEGALTLQLSGAMPRHTGRATSRVVPPGEGPPQDLELQLSPFDLVVTGSVTDALHQPIPGAWVRDRGDPVGTDSAGRYRIEIASKAGSPLLRAGAPGFAMQRLTIALASAGEGSADFVLQPAVQLRGRVSDERGQPVANATVAALSGVFEPVTTGADGSWQLDCADASRTTERLSARKTGYLEARAEVDIRSLQFRCDFVLKRGVRVHGRVTGPDGAALPGAELSLGSSGEVSDRLEAIARDGGVFEFAAVAPGSATMVTSRKGFADDTRVLQVPAGVDELSVEVQLQRGHFLAGMVVDDSGEAVAGASLSLRASAPVAAENGDNHVQYGGVHTRTAVDGTFRLEDLPASTANVEIHGSGIVRKVEGDVPVDSTGLRFVVHRAAAIAGRALDAQTGAPVTRFRIRLVPPRLFPGELPIRLWRHGQREGTAFLVADGSWSVRDDELEAGMIVGVEAAAPGYAPARNGHAVAESGPDPEACILRLQQGGTIAGRVIEQATGAVIAGARVVHFDLAWPLVYDGDDFVRRIETTTSADGSFTLEHVPPGEASLSVEVQGRPARLDGPFPLADGITVRRVVEIPGDTGLSLRLFDPQGAPLANPRASLIDGNSGGAVDHATGGDDGRLVFTGNHPAGDYLVSAYALRDGVSFCANREIRLDPQRALHLDLQVVEGCVLRGKMAGAGPQSFRIDAKRSGAADPLRYYLGEAVDGRFELRGLDPGRYAVRPRSERGRLVPTICALPAGATVDVELHASSRK